MEPNNTKVTLIPDSQISSAGTLLAEAFFADPLNQYVFPDPEERRRVLPWYFAASVREGTLLQSAYSAGEPIKGVAVWTPPGLHERTLERSKQSGLDRMRDSLVQKRIGDLQASSTTLPFSVRKHSHLLIGIFL